MANTTTEAHSDTQRNPERYRLQYPLHDVRRSLHHSVIHIKNPTRCNSVSKFIIPYSYKAQRISGDTPPIIRSLRLHSQPLVLHTWRVVGRVFAGR